MSTMIMGLLTIHDYIIYGQRSFYTRAGDNVFEVDLQFNCLCVGGDTVSACGILRSRIMDHLMMITSI